MAIVLYPYPDLISLLQFQTTPAEYVAAVDHKRKTGEQDMYKSLLPTYQYAVCPICQTVCAEPVDTYSLPAYRFKWEITDSIPYNYPTGYDLPCAHYFGVHTFLNIHDQVLPERIKSLTFINGEIPYLSPWFVPRDVESYAVLHALPICEIEDDTFIPRYTQFSLTYFSQNRLLLLERCLKKQRQAEANDDRYDYFIMAPAPRKGKIEPVYENTLDNLSSEIHKQHYDLPAWVKKGKLGWLNPQTLDLEFGPDKTLPTIYQHIKGRPYFMHWDSGKLKPW